MPTNDQVLKIIIQARNDAKAALDAIDKTLKDIGHNADKAGQDVGKFNVNLRSVGNTASSVKSSFFSLKTAIIGAAAAFGVFKLYNYIKESTLAAARFKTLGVTLVELGNQAGYSQLQLEKQEKGLHETGIAMIETRAILTRMIQSQLDLTKATELARVAQNAAVIANLNSSETFERMLHAIQANSVEILRTIGLNVSFENSYKGFARTLGKSVGQLTENEKVQARFNAVLNAGANIAGAYEAAMTTAGKQMLSLQRYTDNLHVALGEAFEPALAEIIKSYSEFIKEFTEQIKDPAFQKSMADFGKQIATEIRKGLEWIVQNKEAIFDAITKIASATGLAVKGLTGLLNLFSQSQEEAVKQMKANLDTAVNQLEFYEKQVSDIRKKLAQEGEGTAYFFLSPVGSRETLEKNLAKNIKAVQFYKGEVLKYQKAIIDSMKKPVKELEESVQFDWADAFVPYEKAVINKVALPSTLAASKIKAALEDIKVALAEIQSDYENKLIDLQNYYTKKAALDKQAYEQEKKLLEQQASEENDPDKKQRILDRIYALEKQYQIKTIALNNEKIKAEKEAAETRLKIEEQLQKQKIELLSDSKNITQANKAEMDSLKLRQAEEIRELKKQGATRDQIREEEVIHNRQRQELIVKQNKMAGEESLKIQRQLEDAKMNLTDPNDLQQQFQNEIALLQREQDDRLKAIEEAKLTEKERLGAIEEAYRIDQLEKEKAFADQRLRIQQFYVDTASNILGSLNQIFGDLYAASGQKQKEFFKLQKAIAIAQTVISTYEAAQKAYTQYAAWPPLAAAMAAIAIASGLARVAAIRSQNYAEGGLVKGYSSHRKSDNIRINATAGEFMQPVDAVQYYGIDKMEAIRKKIIPREVLANWSFPSLPKRDYSYATGGSISGGISGKSLETKIEVNVNGSTGSDSKQMGKDIARAIKIEFNKNLKDQMRPGGLLFGVGK